MSTYPPVRDDLERLLSQARLNEYKLAVGGKLDTALRLYARSLSASAAFFESMHYLEVALRNTMDEALTRWASTDLAATDPWYRSSAVPATAGRSGSPACGTRSRMRSAASSTPRSTMYVCFATASPTMSPFMRATSSTTTPRYSTRPNAPPPASPGGSTWTSRVPAVLAERPAKT